MRLLAFAVLVAACGGDSSDAKDASVHDGLPRDAAPDAPPDALTAVQRVEPCPEIVAATITTTTTGPYAFVPDDVTIDIGDVVKLAPGDIHNVVPHMTLPSDPGLRSGPTGEVRCVRFTAPGDFHYQCGPHPVDVGVVRVP